MKWDKYLDEEYQDDHQFIERIKHPPKKYEDDEKKPTSRKEHPRNPNKE